MKKILALVLLLSLVLTFAACGEKGTTYSLGSADRARVFYNTYNSYVEKYGEGKSVDGVLHGTAVVRLYDFSDDGYPEMLIAYSSEKDSVVDSVMICGFDMGFAELYNEKITSKASADSTAKTLWVYEDSSDLGYLVLGEDLSLSRSYVTYFKTDSEGNPLYDFAESFNTDGNDLSGVYDKFDINGADFEIIESTNKDVIRSMKNQKN